MAELQEKRPRHYAAEIIKLKSRDERRAALDAVPEHLRGMVRDHIETAFNLRRTPA